jgi:hypothetical protein|nr:MAG TPA: PD-(D/E)XK nuclease superfamily protein [Caudoviricetes sp.]
MNISYSRVQSYLRCPYSHFLGYEVGVKPKKPQRPLYFGTDFHRLLEVRSDPQKVEQVYKEITDTYYEIPANWQSDLGENYLDDLWSIFQDYNDVYNNEKLPSVTEKEFEIPIFEHKGEPYLFKGKIDELYLKKKNGKKTIKIGEHKTFSIKPSNSVLIMNTQKSLYAKAVKFLYGVLPDSVIWDYICSKPAPAPVFLEKSGMFSKTKLNKATPFSYVRACKQYNIEPEADIAAELMENIPNYFFRVEQDYQPEIVDHVWKGFLYQAKLIARYGKTNKTKNMGRDCIWCSYYNICYTQITGGNIKYLLEREYEIHNRTDVVTEERRVQNGHIG